MKKNSIACILFVVIIVSTSCVVTKPYEAPVVGRQNLFRDSSSADTTSMANLHWTDVFRDTLLQNLIQEGIDNNLDLKIAYSRIQQAQAYYNQSKLSFLPNISADATALSGKTAKTSSSPSNTPLYQ